MIKEKEVILLDNKEYTVIATTTLDRNRYAYIINNDNYNDVLFVRNKLNEIEIINEKKILGKLIPLFNEKLSQN